MPPPEEVFPFLAEVDPALRFGLAVLVAILYFTGAISGTAAIVLGIVAVVFLLTRFVGACPAYLPFGISTRGKAAHG